MARRAVQGSHVLVVEVPGWSETRMRVEAELARSGWVAALSPADADILLVCGAPGQELAAVCEGVWAQLPGPRARATVLTEGGVVSTLEQLATELLDEARQRRDARTRSRQPGEEGSAMQHIQSSAHEAHGTAHEEGHSRGHQPAEPDADADADADADMDMDMDMPMPGGIALASGGSDRDGLEMDVLNVPLGPVLPHWPAGLVVRCVLQGDVIVSAGAEVLPAARQANDGGGMGSSSIRRSTHEQGRRAVVRHSDAAVQVLALAGWSSAAGRAGRIRDNAVSGAALVDLAAALEQLGRRIKRSRLLRWTLKGIVVAPGFDAPHDGGSRADAVSVRDRLIEWLDEAVRIARGAPDAYESPEFAAAQHSNLAALPGLITGTDIASARLIVAGLAIDTAKIAYAPEPLS